MSNRFELEGRHSPPHLGSIDARVRAKRLTIATADALDPEQRKQAVLEAGRRAFRRPKGQTDRTAMMQAYYESRQLARIASPRMMQGLIEDADNAEDERVRSVCRLAVLDRAGIRPIDFDPLEGEDEGFDFNPRDYSAEELAVIEAASKLIITRRAEKERAHTLERKVR